MSLIVTIGLIVGGLYGLFAVGIVMIYKATRVLNFAHGEIGMIAPFLALQLWTVQRLPFAVAAVAGVALSAVIGASIDIFFIGKVRRTTPATAFIVMIAIAGALQVAVAYIWGTFPLFFPDPLPRFSTHLAGLRLTGSQLVAVGVIPAVAGLLAIIYRHTLFGLAARALADDPETAEIVGVRTRLVGAGVWALAGAVAGLSAMLAATMITLQVGFMAGLLMRGLTAAMIGGLTSFSGALAGGLIVGVSEAFLQRYVAPGSTEIVLLGATLLILLVLQRTRRVELWASV